MYLLYLDESGTHSGSPSFVLAGLAVHEQDAWHFQRMLEGMLARRLPNGLDPADFELHATEIKNPVKTVRGKKIRSPWASVPVKDRFRIIDATFGAITTYDCQDAARPCALFGAVVDGGFPDREQRAYEEVLHKFDEMLERQAHASGQHEGGIVIHDRRVLEERTVQAWTQSWREVAGRIGKLTHIVDVPFFADSRASRLIQAADFVAWGLFRYYGPAQDERWTKGLWDRFDSVGPAMHGLIHVHPRFRAGTCRCPACGSRVRASSTA
jgi:Protein of unknown function (DUF3800)